MAAPDSSISCPTAKAVFSKVRAMVVMAKVVSCWDRCTTPGRLFPKIPIAPSRCFSDPCSGGWSRGCSGLGECYRTGAGTTVDNDEAIKDFDKACMGGVAPSCFSAYSMYKGLDNEGEAEKTLRRGCELSAASANSNAAYVRTGSPPRAAAVPAVCTSMEQ